MFYSNAKRHQNIKTRTSNEIHNEKIKSYKKTIMELDNRTFTQLVMLAISDGYRKSNILCKTVRANFRKTLSIVCDHSFITNAKFSEKITFPNPWCAYQELGNVRFSEKFAYIPNEWSLFNCYILYWVKKILKKVFLRWNRYGFTYWEVTVWKIQICMMKCQRIPTLRRKDHRCAMKIDYTYKFRNAAGYKLKGIN